MAKKSKGPKGPPRNLNRISAGTPFKAVKDEKGNTKFRESIELQRRNAQKPPDPPKPASPAPASGPSPQVQQSKLQQAAKTMAAKLPPKPAVEKKPPAIKPPGK